MTQKKLAITVTLLGSFSFFSCADGLSDLKSALKLLDNTTEISATLVATTYFQQGEGEDKVIRNGEASISLNDSQQGLKITYSPETLAKLEHEASERVKNENAETPTLNAINKNSATSVKSILSAAPDILRTITRAKFISEENIKGKKQRKLNFELPVSAIINDKRTREYVKKFESQYSIIINENGVPLMSTLTFSGKGRAYIVLSVKASGFEQSSYQVVNQRLIRISNETGSTFNSTFGYSERKSSESLTLLIIKNIQNPKNILLVQQ